MKLTVQEAADFFNVSRTAVYNWLKAGLPYAEEKVIGVKKRKKIETEDVYKFLQVTKTD
jgi:excisionase family DNA binding protein